MDRKTQLLDAMFRMSVEQKGMIFILSLYEEFQKALANPNTNAEEIAAIMKKGPGMTTSVLKMANSSYYGLSKKVSTVKQAISILGFSTINRIFLSQSIVKVFNSDNNRTMNLLWEHSLATAIASSEIAAKKHPELADAAFTAGLLHDIGKFILLGFLKVEMLTLYQSLETNPYQYSTNTEERFFGINHQEVGSYFLEKWFFPDIVIRAVQYHHSLSKETCDSCLPIAVAIGNNISKALEIGKSTSGLIELLPEWIWDRVGVKESNLTVFIYVKTGYIKA